MACLVGCINTFSCGPLVTTVPTDNPAPWVKARFGKGTGGIMTDEIITVGNESCQIEDQRYGEKHHAAIKSMEYGTVDGHKCKLEIVDEEGGAFFYFFRRILKCLDRASIEYQFQVQWGWTGTDCNGFPYAEASPIITFLPINIEVSFSDGVVKYNITGTDAFAVSFVAREDENTGRDDTRVCLQDAIEDIMEKNEPKAKVQFLRKEPSGAITTWKYKPLGPCYDRGPKCAWTYDNQNKMGTVSRWTEPFRTDRDKGVLFQWDNIPSSPTVTMWEDNAIECDESPSCGANHIGTFIVNGGKCLCVGTPILTRDGWKRIEWIVKNQYAGKVACVDDFGNLSWKPITNWYKNTLNGRKYIKVHLHNNRQRAASISGGIFTDDHDILTNEGYVAIHDLDITSHKIHSGTFRPSEEVHQAIIGMMLGDGHIRKGHNNFECVHSEKQGKYARYKSDILGMSIKNKLHKKYGTLKKISGTSSPYWRKMRKTWYDCDGKKVNQEILKDFSAISLAFLFMDDGCLKLTKNTYNAEIATCCFTQEEVDLIIDAIKKLGVNCYRRESDKYPRIHFDTINTNKLSQLISPYIPSCMDRKTLPRHRLSSKKELDKQPIPFFDEFDLIRCEDKEVKNKTVYCIDVEDHHNFITHSGVVHNCSNVISFNPNINWPTGFAAMAQGGLAGATQNSEGKKKDNERPKGCAPQGGSKAGIMQSIPHSRQGTDYYGTDKNTEQSEKGQMAHNKANINREGIQPIEAELRIQGHPGHKFVDAWDIHAAYAAIVVINPFTLAGPWWDGCGDWQVLADSGCNTVLSNKYWKVMGVNHQIKEGSYVTTLKCILPVPGVDISAGQPLGGDPDAFNPSEGPAKPC